MKTEYYRIAISITPNYCNSITYTVAISGSFEEFFKLQNNEYQIANLIMCQQCTQEEYNFYKQFNPKRGSYLIEKPNGKT